MNDISFGGDNYGSVNVGGTVHGDMTGATVSNPRLGELLTLIERLRAEVAEHAPAQAEVIEGELAELAEDARKNPAEVRGRWDRIKGLLTNVAQVGDTAAKIGVSIHQLIGAF
jgi:hypothetical protein